MGRQKSGEQVCLGSAFIRLGVGVRGMGAHLTGMGLMSTVCAHSANPAVVAAGLPSPTTLPPMTMSDDRAYSTQEAANRGDHHRPKGEPVSSQGAYGKVAFGADKSRRIRQGIRSGPVEQMAYVCRR